MSPQPSAGPLPAGGMAAPRTNWRGRIRAAFHGALFLILTTAVLAVQWPLTSQFALAEEDVSPVDIRAPSQIEYTSESLTEQVRNQAELGVAPIYESQRRVRSDQVQRAGEVLAFVESVAADSFADPEQQLAYLRAIPDVQLSQEEWRRVLALDQEAWARAKKQVPVALNAVMMTEIRDNQLTIAKRKVPTFIDLESDEEAQVAISLVQALMRPNTFYNAERTEAARQEARDAVAPQTTSYEQNEIIVRQGDRITPQHIEALEALGLNQPSWNWWQLARSALLAATLGLLFGLYLLRSNASAPLQQHRQGLLTALLATFLLVVKLMVPSQSLLAYIVPLAALTMLIYPLLGLSMTLLTTLYFGIVVGFLTDGSLPIVAYSTIGPLVGALVLGRGERTSAFVRAGAVVALVNLAVLAVFNLPPGDLTLTEYAQLAAAALINGGLAASVTLIGFYLLGTIFDIATPLRLLELARPDHPLLRDLIMKTPGTYHHSLLVSNLAEQAAEAIGADAFLCRVGAYYHDIGKMARPYFFVENRQEGANPHDQLDPWSSAQIIISHIKDGVELAKRYKLPKRIQDFIVEHQGTGKVSYFLHEAQNNLPEGGEIDEQDFRYPGPKPQSKETAILMLADSCESAVRATRPDSKEAIDEIVRRIINQRLIEGELSDSDLTLRDLEAMRQVFVRSLQGVHHPRIQYPEAKNQLPEPVREPQGPNPLPSL